MKPHKMTDDASLQSYLQRYKNAKSEYKKALAGINLSRKCLDDYTLPSIIERFKKAQIEFTKVKFERNEVY